MRIKAIAAALGAAAVLTAGVVSADGKATYDSVCKMCHGTGMAGAPKTGDKAAWADRIAQGTDVLNDHAIKGFKGMPPKGARPSLSDEEVIAATAYMIDASK